MSNYKHITKLQADSIIDRVKRVDRIGIGIEGLLTAAILSGSIVQVLDNEPFKAGLTLLGAGVTGMLGYLIYRWDAQLTHEYEDNPWKCMLENYNRVLI